MYLIGLSSLKLAVDTYFLGAPDGSKARLVLDNIDLSFNLVFIVECILKVLALDFCLDNCIYLDDSWNKWTSSSFAALSST